MRKIKWIIHNVQMDFLPDDVLVGIDAIPYSQWTDKKFCRCGAYCRPNVHDCPKCGRHLEKVSNFSPSIDLKQKKAFSDVARVHIDDDGDVTIDIRLEINNDAKAIADVARDCNNRWWRRYAEIVDLSEKSLTNADHVCEVMNDHDSPIESAWTLTLNEMQAKRATFGFPCYATFAQAVTTERVPRWLIDIMRIISPREIQSDIANEREVIDRIFGWHNIHNDILLIKNTFTSLEKITSSSLIDAFSYALTHGMTSLMIIQLVAEIINRRNNIDCDDFVPFFLKNIVRYQEDVFFAYEKERQEGTLRQQNIQHFLSAYCSRSTKARGDHARLTELAETNPVEYLKAVAEYAPALKR